MTKVVSVRLQPALVQRLERLARRWDSTVSQVAARLIEESVRRAEFGLIDFRDSGAGRQACVQGTSLSVWEVVWVAREFDLDVSRTAGHLGWSPTQVRAALNYFAAFPAEIETAIEDHLAGSFETLSRMLPQAERISPEADPGIAAPPSR